MPFQFLRALAPCLLRLVRSRAVVRRGFAQLARSFGVRALSRLRRRFAPGEHRRELVDFGQAFAQVLQLAPALNPLQVIDLLLRVPGAAGGDFEPTFEFRPLLVLLSSLVQVVAGNAVALHRPAEGLPRRALCADVLASVLLEPRQRLDRGRLAAGGRRGELEFLLERGLLFAGFGARFLLAETEDVSLSDQDRGGQDLSIQTQEPGAVGAAVVEDVVPQRIVWWWFSRPFLPLRSGRSRARSGCRRRVR